MKRPAIALGISAGMVLVGSAVCLPGICGCASYLGIADRYGFNILFFFMALAGLIGVFISLCWLAVKAILAFASRRRTDPIHVVPTARPPA
jgi:predicted membrane protein